MSECPICADELVQMISPPEGYCDHEMCMSCWINVGERNPFCPVCRCDVTEWLKELNVNIKSKEIYDEDENLIPAILRVGSMGDAFARNLGNFMMSILANSLIGRMAIMISTPRRYKNSDSDTDEDNKSESHGNNSNESSDWQMVRTSPISNRVTRNRDMMRIDEPEMRVYL